MDSVRILIAVLSAACLLVATLIVVVVRGPKRSGKTLYHTTKADARTLARVFAVQPVPAKPQPDETAFTAPVLDPDPAPPGRIPGLPPAAPRSSERPLPAGRIPAGPLPFEQTPAQGGWGTGPLAANARTGSGQIGGPPQPARAGGPAFGAPIVREVGAPAATAQSAPNLGRMPGFAPAGQVLSGALPQTANLAEGRRSGALTRVYAEGVQVSYDPAGDAMDIVFSACPLHTPAEIELAFRVLLAKVRTALKPMGRDRAALLVDIAGLEISPNSTQFFGGALKEFLVAICEQIGADRYLIARYNSRTPSASDQQDVIRRIQSMTSPIALSAQSNIFGSRDEAMALLSRLRELAATPGFS